MLFRSGRDLFTDHSSHLSDAGPGGLALNQNRAGAASPLAAAVLASGQAEIIAQNTEQTRFRIYLHLKLLSVHIKHGNLRHQNHPGFKVLELVKL